MLTYKLFVISILLLMFNPALHVTLCDNHWCHFGTMREGDLAGTTRTSDRRERPWGEARYKKIAGTRRARPAIDGYEAGAGREPLVDSLAPNGLRVHPVLPHDRPEGLVQVLPVLEERLPQDAFL